jgi:hypothetical protein
VLSEEGGRDERGRNETMFGYIGQTLNPSLQLQNYVFASHSELGCVCVYGLFTFGLLKFQTP